MKPQSTNKESTVAEIRRRAFLEGMPQGAQRTTTMAVDWMAKKIIELERKAK